MCVKIDQIMRCDAGLIAEFLCRVNSKREGVIVVSINFGDNPVRLGEYLYQVEGEYLVNFNFRRTEETTFNNPTSREDFRTFLDITKVVGDIPVLIIHGSNTEGWCRYKAVFDDSYELQTLTLIDISE